MIRLSDVSEEALRTIPLPSGTDTYTVVPNGVIIDTIKRTMASSNYQFVKASFRTTNSGGVSSGLLHFKGNINEMGMSVGFTNSYNKSRVLRIGCGSVVWICDNGMLSADFGVMRKHTGAIDNELPVAMGILTDMALEEHNKNILQRNEMMLRYLTERERANYFGVLLFEEQLITSVQANQVMEEVVNKEGNFRGNTLWDAYNNVTQVLKTTHPAHLISDHIRLHEVTRELFNLTV